MNELALFNNLFDGFEDDGFLMPSFNVKKAFQTPKVDVKQTENAYILDMDLPGKTEKDVDIELNNKVLTISSVQEDKKEEKSDKKSKDKWILKERSYSHFSRSFTLPEDVDSEKLTATCKNGTLTVTMPRVPATQPKRIEIKTC